MLMKLVCYQCTLSLEAGPQAETNMIATCQSMITVPTSGSLYTNIHPHQLSSRLYYSETKLTTLFPPTISNPLRW